MRELLLELKERLDQLAIVGLRSVKDDFRLKKIQEKLKRLSEKAPVLKKLYDLVTQLLEEDREVVKTFTTLNHLVSAILCTQAVTKLEGEESAIEVLGHKGGMNSLSRSQLKRVREILSGGTTTKWANLLQAKKENALVDYRLLNDYLSELKDTYVYEDYDYTLPPSQRIKETLSMVEIIALFGEPILPLLLSRFDEGSTAEKNNIIKLVTRLGKENYDAYYKKWLEEESNEGIQVNCLRALRFNPENEAFLLGYKTRKKKVQIARLYALAHFDSKTSQEEVKKGCLKDQEIFQALYEEERIFSQKEYLSLITHQIANIKAADTKDIKDVEADKALVAARDWLTLLMRYGTRYELNTLVKLIKENFEIDATQTLEMKFKSRYISQYLLNSGDEEALVYLTTLRNRYEGYYLTTSFMAALQVESPKMVYDTYAPLVTATTEQTNMTKYTLKSILEELASRDSYVKYNEACATCEEKLTCTDSTFSYRERWDYIPIEKETFARIVPEDIVWDQRWIAYVAQRDLGLLQAYFMFNAMDQEGLNHPHLYEEMLSSLKAHSGKGKVFPNIANTERKIAMAQIQMILRGFLKTGKAQRALEEVPYFIFYLGSLEQMYFNEMTEEDLVYLKDLEAVAEEMSEHHKKKIVAFVKRARIVVPAKEGHGDNRKNGCCG